MENPYVGTTLFGFIVLFFQRASLFLRGGLSLHDLAHDEIQLLVLIPIALSGTLIGTYLIVRKVTMLSNALSHTILIGIVLAVFILPKPETGIFNISHMLIAALFSAIITVFATHFLIFVIGIQEDAGIGVVFTSFFALGLVLLTLLTRNTHVGTEAVMGSLDILKLEDAFLPLLVLAINVILIWLFHKEYTLTSFDPAFAKTLGLPPIPFSYLIMLQTAMTCIAAFRSVGVVMILAFLIGPPLTAKMLTASLKPLMHIAAWIGIICAFLGVALSRHLLSYYQLAVSTAGLTTFLIGLSFFFATAIATRRKKHSPKILNSVN